jgi:GntR family transcriptional repressor for pyruvate dehydrogenase complex
MFDTIHGGNKISQQIIVQIRNLIFEGKLSPGEKLPPEHILTKQFGVSRQTLREALRALEFIGLIDIKKGSAGGPCIAEMDSSNALEILTNYLYFKKLTINHLSEVRKIVEPPAAAMAAAIMTEEELEEMGKVIETSRKANLDSPVIQETGYYDLRFHRLIGECTRNPLLIIIIDFIETVMEDMKRLHRVEKKYYTSIFQSHELIYEALRARDGKAASSEMYAHIIDVQNHLFTSGDTGVWEITAPLIQE